MFTVKINELPREESEAILRFLYAHATRPEFQARFRWQRHSVAFWDNRAVQRMALWDYHPQTRSGFRVTITGDRPFQGAAYWAARKLSICARLAASSLAISPATALACPATCGMPISSPYCSRASGPAT